MASLFEHRHFLFRMDYVEHMCLELTDAQQKASRAQRQPIWRVLQQVQYDLSPQERLVARWAAEVV